MRLFRLAFALALAALAGERTVGGATFTVNTLSDTVDVSWGDGICADSSNQCSFRAALQEVAARSGGDTIAFSVSGTIVLTNGLPWVTQASTTVDGTGQTVVIQGSAVGGLHLASANNVVKNLAFTSFGSYDTVTVESAQNGNLLDHLVVGGSTTASGILIHGNFTVVTGCHIGTDAAGLVANPNSAGITVAPSLGNRIGGTTAAERNVISGNFNGIVVSAGALLTTVEGNFIGTDATGTAALPNSATGLLVSANLTAVGGTVPGAGNVISGNGQYGIQLLNGQSTTIAGNLIGLAADGSTPLGDGQFGVYLAGAGSSNNAVGGTAPGARNVISGITTGGGYGVYIGSSTAGTQVVGNYVGTDATGLLARGSLIGVFAQSPATIGGTTAAAANVVSGNGIGVQLNYIASGELVEGNLIGVAADGSTALGNTGVGVDVIDGVFFSTIGGTAAGAGNVIANNGAQGVLVTGSSSVPRGIGILGNSIHDNGALGIDLAPNGVTGVTADDPCDADTGPNDLQNFPVILSAVSGGGSTTIQGTLDSVASGTYRVEVFASPAADPSGHGEGAVFLGAVVGDVATDVSCHGTWLLTVPGSYASQAITATASDYQFNTSEFSAAYTATPVTLQSFTAE